MINLIPVIILNFYYIKGRCENIYGGGVGGEREIMVICKYIL